MNTILVISSNIFGDGNSLKAAFKAADILRHEYSTTVFVEVVNSLNSLEVFNEMPKIRIGNNELVIEDNEDIDHIVNKIVDLVLENISVGSLNNVNDNIEIFSKNEPESYMGVFIE
ncbi:hypothetical protein [Caldisphaera lagunensis]|uniref:hypothetical protein n=1 Tax=Caldisphaera lagunensis TaxID=200415 RepID=UPI000662B8A5|nr:hypothetical protein [Caldisphaera lagunensis]